MAVEDFDSAIGTATIATSITITSGHSRVPRRSPASFANPALARSASSLIGPGVATTAVGAETPAVEEPPLGVETV